MISNQNDNNLLTRIFKELTDADSEGIKKVLEILLNAAMQIERGHFLKADAHERNDERIGYANGYKPKHINTTLGRLDLSIPQARGLIFHPQCLEKGLRSERALKAAIAEMYLQGVGTRKVQSITEELCGLEISSTQVSRATKELDDEFDKFRNRPIGSITYLVLDALYLKVRQNSMVVDMAVLMAYGVSPEGKREILGASMSLSEAEVHWRDFLQGLQSRGMTGVQLIISDNHSGLKSARKAIFPSVPWQRCQFHLCQNAQSYAPRKHMRGEFAEVMREIFNSPTLDMAREMKNKAIDKYKKIAPEFAKWLEDNVEEGLTVFNFPKHHWKKIRTSNGIERVNREIKRRTRVAVLFPNSESALRLVTAVLMEIHESWITGKKYLDMEFLATPTFRACNE